jgi:hypothetical protein
MTEKKSAGRPAATLTPEQVKELEALSQYLTQDQLADYFGIAERTLRKIFEREPDIYASYKKGQARAIARSAQKLTQKAWGYREYVTDSKGHILKDEYGNPVEMYMKPDTTALIFHLKSKGGWRETANLEVMGKGGKDLAPTIDWKQVPTEIIQAILAAQVDDDDPTTEPSGLH